MLEYIKCFELLNVCNDSSLYYALQDRMPKIHRRFSFSESESYTKVYEWAKQTLKEHDNLAVTAIYNELTEN